MSDVRITAALLTVALALTACQPEPAPPHPTAADLPGAWCASSGDRLDLAADGSARLTGLSDHYLAHVLGELRETWTDEYIWRTWFGGRPPSSAQGTWSLADRDRPWARLDFGVREGRPDDRDPGSPQRIPFGDELRVERDGSGFALAAYDGMPDEGAAAWFTPCR